MSERFKSNKNKKLQNAYGIWASKKDDKQIIAICLNDPEHEMAAFFGIAETGKKVCVVSSDMIKILDKRYTVLRKKKNPSNLPINISKTNNFVTFTSGSTKKPKAILRSHKSWIYSFNKNGVLESDTVAALGHLSHSLTLYAATEAMHIGANLIFTGLRPLGEPTIIYATPTLLKLVYKNNIIYPKVRKIFIGGGTFNDLDRDFCQQRFPNAEIKVFYGTAETSFITISDNKTPPNSVGLAYEGVKLETINGEVFVTTPMIAENYLDEEISMNVVTPFSTGEIGHIDNDGFLFLDGRLDRAVNISDKIVHLDTLENDLMSLSGIKYAAVITIPDAKRGQKAFAAVYGGIASHPQISGIINLKEWPLLLSGKTDYIKVTASIKEAFYEK
jgi:long-chain acyl-CoA synthetase